MRPRFFSNTFKVTLHGLGGFIMKFLITLSMLLSYSNVSAQSVESIFSPTIESDRPQPRPRPDRPQARTRLFLQNNCYTDVYAVIRYKNVRNQIESKGFWRIYPGQIIHVTNMKDRSYLLHAFTSDNRIQWNGPYALPFEGRTYPAMMVNLTPNGSGDWTSVLNCR